MTDLTINGRIRSFGRPLKVSELIMELDMVDQRIAIELNGQIIPRSEFNSLMLEAGDKLEIVVAVGGG